MALPRIRPVMIKAPPRVNLADKPNSLTRGFRQGRFINFGK